MRVQSTRFGAERYAQPDLAPEPKVAVLLNANAKRVTDKVIHRVSHVIPEEDLYVSRTLDDARIIAEKVVERRYHTVFTGGGDGTFVAFVNAIRAEILAAGGSRMPRFGVLKLGTGNSLATLIGASSLDGDGILDDILRARADEVPSVRRVDMLELDGQLVPFAGLGYDGAVLNNYMELTRQAGPAKDFVAGGLGYFMAVAFKTIPHYLVHPKPVQAEVVCEGRGMRMGADGKPTHTYQAGDVMYRGPVKMLSASTVPHYGYGFRMFPYAGTRRGMMQVRAATVGATAVLSNLPGAWNGTFRPPEIHDFLCDGASVRLERPMPMQVAGDAGGYRDHVKFKVADRSVDLVDFTATLN